MERKLLNRGFLSLIITQFFGAANDNILKGILIYMVIDGTWAGVLGSGGQGIVSICFTLPFILLSGYAGQFADRNSKRYVAVLVKTIEIPIAVVVLIGFWMSNLWITLLALVALTCQSAFFGPAKYGMIPELVESHDLSRANGAINMMTNLAVIIGTLAGGVIVDVYSPQTEVGSEMGARPLWLPGTALVIVALVGLAAVVFLPRLEPGDRTLKYDLNPFATYFIAFRKMANSPLLIVMFAWGYFYFVAWIAMLIIPEYTVVLKITRTDTSVLLGVMGVAIGAGSVLAGVISGHAIRPRLIPIGALGMIVFFTLLGTVPPTLPELDPTWNRMWRIVLSPVSAFIFGAGIFAGFYIIPLQALLQRLSPDDERGRFLGTANGLSFTFLTLSAALYWIIRPAFETSDGVQCPQKIFLICAVLLVVGTTFFLWRMKARGFSFSRVE